MAVFATIEKTAMGVVTSAKEFEAAVGESLSKSSVEVDAVGNVAIGDDGARVGEAVRVDAVGVDAVGDDSARVGEAVGVDAVWNVAVGDDGARVG